MTRAGWVWCPNPKTSSLFASKSQSSSTRTCKDENSHGRVLYIPVMRYSWIGSVAMVALLGAGCGTDGYITPITASTASTAPLPPGPTAPPVAPGPKDKVACSRFNIIKDLPPGTNPTRSEYLGLIDASQQAENPNLHAEGTALEDALITGRSDNVRKAEDAIASTCSEMGIGSAST